MLVIPNFNLPFKIETHALRYGVGVVLILTKRPIPCYGHTLAMRDRAKPMYERKLMIVVLTVKR